MYLNNAVQEKPVCRTCDSIRAPVVSTQQCNKEAAAPKARCAPTVVQGAAVKSNFRQAWKIMGANNAQAYHSIAFHQRFLPHVIGKPSACSWKESLVAKNRARIVAAATTPTARFRTTLEITEGLMKTKRLAWARAIIVPADCQLQPLTEWFASIIPPPMRLARPNFCFQNPHNWPTHSSQCWFGPDSISNPMIFEPRPLIADLWQWGGIPVDKEGGGHKI